MKIDVKTFPKLGLWFHYPLSKCAFLLDAINCQLKAHVLVLGPYAFMVAWRVPKNEKAPDAS